MDSSTPVSARFSEESLEEAKFQGLIETTEKPLTVFVVDMSMPGGLQRINAVKGAIAHSLPHEKVAVINCFDDDAQLVLEPTSSFIRANRRLSNIRKSVMGNLANGLNIALDVINAEFKVGTPRIVVAVIADGKAHGLVSGTSDCIVDEGCCNVELMLSAEAIAEARVKASLSKQRLDVVLVDTEDLSTPLIDEGSRLASASNANYIRSPELTDIRLIK